AFVVAKDADGRAVLKLNIHAGGAGLVDVDVDVADGLDQAIGIAIDHVAERPNAVTLIHDVSQTQERDRVGKLNVIHVHGSREIRQPGRLIHGTERQRVRILRQHIGVAALHGTDDVHGVVQEGVGDVGATGALVITFSETCRTNVARTRQTEAQVFDNLPVQTHLPGPDAPAAFVVRVPCGKVDVHALGQWGVAQHGYLHFTKGFLDVITANDERAGGELH